MTTDSDDNSVSGGHKSCRITTSGRLLRKARLDEIPQLFNILKGDMRLIGPRPPLPKFVHLRPQLYENVLRAPPGITGLATLSYHAKEEHLLRHCASLEETNNVYLQHCVPIKADLDLYWARHASGWLDAMLLGHTILHIVSKTVQNQVRRFVQLTGNST